MQGHLKISVNSDTFKENSLKVSPKGDTNKKSVVVAVNIPCVFVWFVANKRSGSTRPHVRG